MLRYGHSDDKERLVSAVASVIRSIRPLHTATAHQQRFLRSSPVDGIQRPTEARSSQPMNGKGRISSGIRSKSFPAMENMQCADCCCKKEIVQQKLDSE